MSFLTEPQAIIIVLVLGFAAYLYAMIRASIHKAPKEGQAAEAREQFHSSSPIPPPPPSTSTEAYSSLNDHLHIKKLLHIKNTPLDEKLIQIATIQRQQAQRLDEQEERIGELKFAVEMKPDPAAASARAQPPFSSEKKSKKQQEEKPE